LFILQGAWFWRIGYIFLIIAVTTEPGIWLLQWFHLKTAVPYGRVTVLLNFFATALFLQSILLALERRRVLIFLCAFLAIVSIGMFALSEAGLPKEFVKHAFESANVDPGNFATRYAVAFKLAIANHAKFVYSSTIVLFGYLVFLLLNQRAKWLAFGQAFTAVLIAAITLLDAVLFYDAARPKGSLESEYRFGLFQLHPVENALVKDGANFRLYRLHIDIPFKEQRDVADLTTHLIGKDSSQHRHRLVPNGPMAANIAITGGYSSVVPGGRRFSELLVWSPNHPSFFRAQGDHSILHPAFFDVFAVRYVLRHREEATRAVGWQHKVNQPWEDLFQKNATLIYEDDTYRLYRYEPATPIFHIPARIVFSDEVVSSASALFDPSDRWQTTGVLPTDERAKAGHIESVTRIERNGVIGFSQSGEVLSVQDRNGGKTMVIVRTETPVYLFAGLKLDPWWKVYVDGVQVTPIRANGVFMAVFIPAGTHDVLFDLQPTSAILGLAISGISFVLLIAGMAVTWYIRAPRKA
jgi:hypothetical protein